MEKGRWDDKDEDRERGKGKRAWRREFDDGCE